MLIQTSSLVQQIHSELASVRILLQKRSLDHEDPTNTTEQHPPKRRLTLQELTTMQHQSQPDHVSSHTCTNYCISPYLELTNNESDTYMQCLNKEFNVPKYNPYHITFTTSPLVLPHQANTGMNTASIPTYNCKTLPVYTRTSGICTLQNTIANNTTPTVNQHTVLQYNHTKNAHYKQHSLSYPNTLMSLSKLLQIMNLFISQHSTALIHAQPFNLKGDSPNNDDTTESPPLNLQLNTSNILRDTPLPMIPHITQHSPLQTIHPRTLKRP